MARTHALYLMRYMKRRHQGYDLCDEQHCQVYKGLRAESQRSREVVDATRGKILEYRGRVAHVIYMSNCGGHTQDSADLSGWSPTPYLHGLPDGQAIARPETPWELRRWLTSWPQAYCKPSNDVHPYHFRWQRVIPFSELSEKVDRKLKTGTLKALRTLRRSRSGNVNAIQLIGSKRTARVDSEIQIRGLLGIGSLRSTLFFVDTELGADGKPETLVFHGGGWGHGVGLCQSGAMGRADAGQSFEQIVTGYFKGSSLGDIRY
ncbi:MAG: SpoIID/LytB domain-containing protein [Patescibacteria group bacterium]